MRAWSGGRLHDPERPGQPMKIGTMARAVSVPIINPRHGEAERAQCPVTPNGNNREEPMVSRRARLLAGATLTLGILAGLAGPGRANDSLMKAAADVNSWPMYGRGYDNTRFSPLSQVNAQNASQLKLAFA